MFSFRAEKQEQLCSKSAAACDKLWVLETTCKAILRCPVFLQSQGKHHALGSGFFRPLLYGVNFNTKIVTHVQTSNNFGINLGGTYGGRRPGGGGKDASRNVAPHAMPDRNSEHVLAKRDAAAVHGGPEVSREQLVRSTLAKAVWIGLSSWVQMCYGPAFFNNPVARS